jgi:hypothetical protein
VILILIPWYSDRTKESLRFGSEDSLKPSILPWARVLPKFPALSPPSLQVWVVYSDGH